MKRFLFAAAALLASSPLSAQTLNGPRMGLDGSIHSPSSSYGINGATGAATFGALATTSGLSVAGGISVAGSIVPASGAAYSINGRTGVIVAPNVAVSPLQFLSATQTVAQALGGTIDAQPIMAAAIAGGGKIVVMPCGTYRFDSPLTISQSILRITGQQQGCVHVVENFATGSAFNIVGANTVQIDNIEVSPASGITRSSGASFHEESSYGVMLDHVQSVADYKGFELEGGTNQFTIIINNFSVINAIYAAVHLTDTDGTSATQVKDVYINTGSIGGSARGLYLQDSSGSYMNQIDVCCGGGTGVLVNPLPGQNVNADYYTKVLSDEQTSTNGGWLFNNGGGFVTETYMTDCWGSGAANGPGLTINNINMDGAVITNFQAHSNAQEAINVLAGTNLVFTGAEAFYNNKSNTGLPGILISGTASHVTVSNSYSGKGGYVLHADPAQSNYQSYGIAITGSASYVNAYGNSTFGNTTGGMTDTSSNSSTNIHSNNLSQ